MSKKQDKKRKAKHPGKRTSASGNTYFENRLNRADLNRTLKLKKGGILKGLKKDLNKNVSFKQILKGK